MSRKIQIKDRRKQPRKQEDSLASEHNPAHFDSHSNSITPFYPKTNAQKHYFNAIKSNIITFGVGCAGTGKSHVAASYAAELLNDKKIERIFITRPAVEAGEKLGFLPGSEAEKYLPYILPFLEIFYKVLGRGATDYFIRHGKICPVPLGFLQGRTFENCFVVFDEAENSTPFQMKMFLTRIGPNCKVVVDGDLDQICISGSSGMADAIDRLRDVAGVGITQFTVDDVVRSGIVKDVLRAYSKK